MLSMGGFQAGNVSARQWKRDLGLIGKEKDASRCGGGGGASWGRGKGRRKEVGHLAVRRAPQGHKAPQEVRESVVVEA